MSLKRNNSNNNFNGNKTPYKGKNNSFNEKSQSTSKSFAKTNKPFKGKQSFGNKPRPFNNEEKSFNNEYSSGYKSFNDKKPFKGKQSFGNKSRPFNNEEKSFSNEYSSSYKSFNDKKPFKGKKSFVNNPRPFNNEEKNFNNEYSSGYKSFNDKKPFKGKKSFGNNPRPFNNEEKSFNNEYSSSYKSFNDKKPFKGKKQFLDRKTHGKVSFSNKRAPSYEHNYSGINKNIENKISLEYVLNYFHQNEIVDLILLQNNLSPENLDMFFSKVNLLLKRGLIENIEENKFKLAQQYINEDFEKYSYIKIKSHLIANHFIVDISPLSKKQTREEEIIIEDLKDNLKDRIILSQISLQEEKIIATPMFYLNELQTIGSLPENNVVNGIYQVYNETDFIIPLNYKSRKNITLLNTPKSLTIGCIVEANLITTNEEAPTAIFKRVISQDKSTTNSSMLSVYQYNLRNEFSTEILDIAKNFGAVSPSNRKDIRNIPLVTIDDDDAKDFDDAIFAQKISETENSYKIYVAIADVSWYVKEGDLIDNEAQLRGNSVYLPGLTIPMLPKELSNGWCSLNPNEDRGCLVMEGIINRNGELESFEFYRGLMKSHARLTYSAVANALNGENIPEVAPLMKDVILPLKEVFQLLEQARKRRNAVEINTTEAKFILDSNSNILDVKVKESLVSHKIVEEFMITANVAAAKLIAKAGLSLSGLAIYRVHAKPSAEKVLAFVNTLKSFGMNIKPPVNVSSTFFNNLLKEFSHKSFFNALNEAVLRCQSQAEYSNENIGHFGLALKEYCHFTSPIRRYSDLMIHRLILSIINEKPFNYTAPVVNNISQAISLTERLAFNAEKSAKNRAFSKWLSSKIGESFMSEISSITNAGIFVNLIDNGASGLIPMRTISRGFANVDTNMSIIKDKHSGRVFKLGDKLPIIIKEADEIRGLLTFLIDEDNMPKKIKNKFS